MSFSQKIKNEIMVASARHCCVCRKSRGLKIEIHHILPKEQGGEDTFENAIALCFDCHADAGHYYAKHPKGTKFSPTELFKHKETWFKIVERGNIPSIEDHDIQIEIDYKKSDLQQILTKETTVYKEVSDFKKVNYKKILKELKSISRPIDDPWLFRIKTFQEFIDFLNGKPFEKFEKNNEEYSSQPKFSELSMRGGITIIKNHSVCDLSLKVINTGTKPLKNFKLYIEFENVIQPQVVDKRKNFLEENSHHYNTKFTETSKAVYIPKNSILVQEDYDFIDQICFKTELKDTKCKIKWQFFAEDFNKTGEIEFDVITYFEITENAKYVDEPEKYQNESKILTKTEIL